MTVCIKPNAANMQIQIPKPSLQKRQIKISERREERSQALRLVRINKVVSDTNKSQANKNNARECSEYVKTPVKPHRIKETREEKKKTYVGNR